MRLDSVLPSTSRVARLVTGVRLGLVGLCIAGTGCAVPPSDPVSAEAAVATAIEAAFPVLEDLRVESLWVDDDCRYIVYSRGAFSAAPGSLLCEVIDKPRPMLLDASANADIARVVASLLAGGLDLDYASVQFDAGGSVAKHSFFKPEPCLSFHYDPAWVSLPVQEDSIDPVARAIDGDWYVLEGC